MKLLFIVETLIVFYASASSARYKNIPHYQQQFPEVLYQWNQLDYAFPNENVLQAALGDQTFVPGAGVPVDVQPYYNRT